MCDRAMLFLEIRIIDIAKLLWQKFLKRIVVGKFLQSSPVLLPSKRMGLMHKVAGGGGGCYWRSLKRLKQFILERSKSCWLEKINEDEKRKGQGRKDSQPRLYIRVVWGLWGRNLEITAYPVETILRTWHILIHLIFLAAIKGGHYLFLLNRWENSHGTFRELTQSHITKNWQSWDSNLGNV